MEYVLLTDREYGGTIVRAEAEKQYEYIKGRGWVRSGIMTLFQSDESEFYNLYEEITEAEALRRIKEIENG